MVKSSLGKIAAGLHHLDNAVVIGHRHLGNNEDAAILLYLVALQLWQLLWPDRVPLLWAAGGQLSLYESRDFRPPVAIILHRLAVDHRNQRHQGMVV